MTNQIFKTRKIRIKNTTGARRAVQPVQEPGVFDSRKNKEVKNTQTSARLHG